MGISIMQKSYCLKTILLLALTVSFISPAVSHELGLQLYSVRHQMEKDIPNTFAEISNWGLKIVEGGGNHYGLSAENFRNELIKNDLQIVSVDTSFEEVRDNPMAVVYKARYFGSRYATFYWIPHDGKKGFTIQDAKGAVKAMNNAGKILKANGITLQYHPHGYEFLPHQGGTILDYMLQHTKHAAFQMDVFWVKQAGMDPTALLQQYPGKFLSLHLKDRLKGTQNSTDYKAVVEANVVLGTGDVGISSVVAEAKKQGIRYFFIEDESSRVMIQVPESIKYLKQLDNLSH
ncbi:sugar phosphate isomerase/epimerase [Paraglaciecola aquimarina]|uniref:Sugar phosphate isomerase/epimerase n=1 Tax=Paraglaciecola algarum TaxID=3050085 RepID=A0ABS9D5S9_9ALTE|nr:sugar phosphate isomerase/epimerase [Paraglaciecola sp. G1-23]MCF2947377.1 sugar phosphate isomerase/epimerase [Paraglaciecola sp. G1-23]